jgi:hypothetical protein
MGNVATLRWSPGLDSIKHAVDRYGDRVLDDVEHTLLAYGDEVTAYMRAHHKWQNITFAAERGLRVFVERVGDHFIFAAASTAPHGEFLERKPEYAIVGPTMEIFGPRMWQSLKDIVE